MKRDEKKPMTLERALQRASALCARSEQAPSDIYSKLLSWGLDEAAAAGAVERLKRENFLNEARYATAFVRDKFRFNHWGRVKIAYALRQKGIADSFIGEAMEEISEDDYRAALLTIMRNRAREVRGKEPRLARAAVVRHAASRGFEAEMIYPLLNSVFDANDD